MSNDKDQMPPLAISPRQAAQMLGVSRDFVYDLIEQRLVLSAKAGSRVLVDYQSVLDYFESIRRTA